VISFNKIYMSSPKEKKKQANKMSKYSDNVKIKGNDLLVSFFTFRGTLKEMPQCHYGKRISLKSILYSSHQQSHNHTSHKAYHFNHIPLNDLPFLLYNLNTQHYKLLHICTSKKEQKISLGKIKILSASHQKYKTAGNICFLLFHLAPSFLH